MALKAILNQKNIKGKTFLIRIDSDVDLDNETVVDDTRLESSIETINYIRRRGGESVLIGHMGRPQGKAIPQLSLFPVAKWFSKRLGGKVEEVIIQGFKGWKIAEKVILLENIRFFKEEEKNDLKFASKLARLGDVFVNESFATSHRNHASCAGVAKMLPSFAGLHLDKEVKTLKKIIKNPRRPLVVLIGGAKIETKLPVVKNLHKIADYVLVGGKIAEETKVLIKVQHEKIKGKKSVIFVADNTLDGNDITEKDTENFIQILNLAKTIIWNGPVGKIENPENEKNTLKIALAIANSKAFSVVGGGDSLAFLQKHKLLDKYSLVSTGGGAMLDLLSGKKLPGLEVLEKG